MPKIVDAYEQRAHLAEAALRIITKEGINAATVRSVAKEAGVSTGAFQHYFGHKRELLRFALQYATAETRRHVESILQTSSGLEAVRRVLAEVVPLNAEARAHCQLRFCFWSSATTDPDVAAEQTAVYTGWRDLLVRLLRQAEEDGELAPGLDLQREASGIIAFVDGLAVQATFEPAQLPPRRQLELVDRYLNRLTGVPA